MRAGCPEPVHGPNDAGRRVWVRILMLVAALGLAGSMAVHLLTWTASNADFRPWTLIALPMAIAAMGASYFFAVEFSGYPPQRAAWKIALSGCPKWVRPLLYLLMLYTGLSFTLGFIRMFALGPLSGEPHLLRMGTCFLIPGYAASLCVCWSTLRRGQ